MRGSQPPKLVLKLTEQVRFFRVMATFLSSGLTLLAALQSLELQDESPALRQLASSLQTQLLQGRSLTNSISRSAAFPPFVLSLVRCAEQTGQLHATLKAIAEHLENDLNRLNRLRSTLIYPAFVFTLVLAMALLLPPFLLSKGMLGVGNTPWPTRWLLTLGRWAGHPLTLLLLTLSIWLMIRVVRQQWEQIRPWIHRLAATLPGLRRLRSAWLEVTLCTSLGLQLQVGLPLLGAAQRALESCDNPLWQDDAPRVLRELSDGESLSSALLGLEGIRPKVSHLVAAGEELGRLGQSFQWLARLSQDEFDSALDHCILLLEPLVLVMMGVVVGCTCLAALLPGLQMLQSL